MAVYSRKYEFMSIKNGNQNMHNIKLLYIINYLNQGGPSKVLIDLIEMINKSKYQVTVLTIINQNDPIVIEELKKSGVTVIGLEFEKKAGLIPEIYKCMMNQISDICPDIIHTHGIVSTILLARKKKYKKVTTIHNCIFEDYAYSYGKIKGKILAELHLMALRQFEKVICCSKASYNAIKDRVPNVQFIRNGCALPETDICDTKSIREEIGVPITAKLYIYAGVLSKGKRVLELIELFEKNNESGEYLIILGDGPLRTECERKAAQNIKVVGFKQHVRNYMRAADVYISNSASEGFSVSVMEAISCGLYCFLSNIPSHQECMEIDNTYYIGELFEESTFAEQKKRLLRKMDIGNRENIKKFFFCYLSSEVMARQYERQYEEVENAH